MNYENHKLRFDTQFIRGITIAYYQSVRLLVGCLFSGSERINVTGGVKVQEEDRQFQSASPTTFSNCR
jgi:hypothetical protein